MRTLTLTLILALLAGCSSDPPTKSSVIEDSSSLTWEDLGTTLEELLALKDTEPLPAITCQSSGPFQCSRIGDARAWRCKSVCGDQWVLSEVDGQQLCFVDPGSGYYRRMNCPYAKPSVWESPNPTLEK